MSANKSTASDIAYGLELKKGSVPRHAAKDSAEAREVGGQRKSRDFDPIFSVSLPNRSAMTVTAPLAFWT
jgi:hypothetical protein